MKEARMLTKPITKITIPDAMIRRQKAMPKLSCEAFCLLRFARTPLPKSI